jgi:hypothetical protein
MRPEEYLVIPEGYGACLGRLRWSEAGDAVETGDGKTFAFAVEIIHFLEGFAAQGRLIHFAFLLHLLALLRPTRIRPPSPPSLLSEAFSSPGRNVRNAGAFCALLCRDISPAIDPPTIEQLWDLLQAPGWRSFEGPAVERRADLPPLEPAELERRVRTALEKYSIEEVLHWLHKGCGPAPEAGKRMAEEMQARRPRGLSGVLARLAEHARLREAAPFVAQLVSALTLPPRRLVQPELPLGGYSDVATRGAVEHLLPSQLVFDGEDFVRRHASNELLYFRREEPQQPIAQTLIVLLDQGVRTWGIVRVVLTAALFALGRLAERKHFTLTLAATSTGGRLLDPLHDSAQELEKALAASDLSAHPGLALEAVLQEQPGEARDVVLLSHPRSLAEPDVAAAARRAGPLTRVFAVTVNDRGDTALHQLQHGGAVSLSRFHVDLQAALPPAQRPDPHPRRIWQGDVEPIGYPFQLGLEVGDSSQLAFDSSGQWLLLSSTSLLYLMRSDGTGYEILPGDALPRSEPIREYQVLGVTGGFVVVYRQQLFLIAVHYDLGTRTVRHHRFSLRAPTSGEHVGWCCYYFRKLHTLVVMDLARSSVVHSCCHLATADRSCPPAVTCFHPGDLSGDQLQLPVQGNGNPEYASLVWVPPSIHLNSATGRLQLSHVVPAWKAFTPLEEGRPLLRGCLLIDADCQEHTLAALFEEEQDGKKRNVLRLFQGPQGIPLTAIVLRHDGGIPFALSNDGRLLAWQQDSGALEVRETAPGGRVRHFPEQKLCYPNVEAEVHIELHDFWLIIRNSDYDHLVWWSQGRLSRYRGKAPAEILATAGLPTTGRRGRKEWVPPALQSVCPDRFRQAAQCRLRAVSDCFGQVALLSSASELVCMFYTQEDKLAAWMPDGTCLGPSQLLGCSETPGAAEKIGRALLAASTGGKAQP